MIGLLRDFFFPVMRLEHTNSPWGNYRILCYATDFIGKTQETPNVGIEKIQKIIIYPKSIVWIFSIHDMLISSLALACNPDTSNVGIDKCRN